MPDKASFEGVTEPSTSPMWKQEAIRLAHERKIVGKVEFTGWNAAGLMLYNCPSSTHETIDYRLTWDSPARVVRCSCEAGQHGRPCAHAGATLMLLAGYTVQPGEPNRNMIKEI